ncbi:MAG: leucyl/phenylalanyl-tRNA--protein transferase, partial [Nocardioidaceae bacterium]|nr:leucyl/phenylalanyl-tRNA--protein transferase [Nocardioidaceae bacterium]
LYGIAVGGLFAGESMFHLVPDASKVALAALVDLLDDEHVSERVVDVQWCTPHLASLGVEEVPRADYLALLPAVLDLPLPAAFAGS